MGLELDPAALGGLAGLIAFAGWALGRVQGGWPAPKAGAPELALSPRGTGELEDSAFSPPSPCQQRAFEERRAILARPVELAELHDQVSAIRRDERVFEKAATASDLLLLFAKEPAGACRYLGRSGQPTCPGAVRGPCHHGKECAAPSLRAAPTGIAPTALPASPRQVGVSHGLSSAPRYRP